MPEAESEGQKWVIPSEIPFENLKARDLEECVYWLLDALGARDLEWRVGGSGNGTADGGRDLEATFYVPSPDGEMEAQRWWIECKGRRETVEPDAVKSAANNAAVMGGHASLVVVTNTTFSNPTRDWVKNWQEQHPRPKIKLWDHETLERLLSKHPQVALRLFSEALSHAGLLKVAQLRFWERLEYTPIRALQSFWANREHLEIESVDLVALIANEFGHGNINDRPWAAQSTGEQLIDAWGAILINLPYLQFLSIRSGVDQRPLLAAMAHIALTLIQQCDVASLTTATITTVAAMETETLPDESVDALLAPVLSRLAGEMQDICSSDCRRVIRLEDSDTLVGNVNDYWKRFDPTGRVEDKEPRRSIRIESMKEPCKVGFEVDHIRSCPLFELTPSARELAHFFEVIERVSHFRLAEFKGKARTASG